MAPDLSDIGASQPLGQIRESILDPSKNLHLAGNEAVTVTLKSGKTVEGLARNRNNYSLQVLDRKGDLHLISMLDVAQLSISSKSLMPGDYAKRLSSEELRDLLAYLSRQFVRPATPAEENK